MSKLTLNSRGPEVKELQDSLLKIGFVIPQHELDEQVFGMGTLREVQRLQRMYNLTDSQIVDEKVRMQLTVAIAEQNQFRVEGRIFFDNQLPADDLALKLYHRGFADAELLLIEGKTDANGFYNLIYEPKTQPVNLEIRAVDSIEKEISLSKTKIGVSKHEVLNLIAPVSVRPFASEFSRLQHSLSEQLGRRGRLADAQETDERRDLTFLHQATRWDARLIALAAKADQLSTDTGLSQEVLYALFRIGLPSNRQELARLDSTLIEEALHKANSAKIAAIEEMDIIQAVRAFETFAQTTLRKTLPAGAVSTYDSLLARSGLNAADQALFSNLLFAKRSKPAELWEEARQKGFSETQIQSLQLQGKLAQLTRNNADLTAAVQRIIGTPDNLAQLVDHDFHQVETWKALLQELSGGEEKKLKSLIPAVYEGNSITKQLNAYTDELARQIRINFPTQVIARLIETDQLQLNSSHNEIKTQVPTFLKNGAKLGFVLGRVPLNPFIRDQGENGLFTGIDAKDRELTIQQVKNLQRLYQLTPTDEALSVLLKHGFTSASDIVALSQNAFIQNFGSDFPSLQEATLVYQKAQQISAITYNFYGAAQLMTTSPPLYVTSPPTSSPTLTKGNLLKQYPTLESMFGSMDYCECEHCRSVLSPAAYFVDLLHFIDPDELTWNVFLNSWKKDHANQAYPGKKPYDALIERRPDLPHLALTCENTNTTLPYIDLVNEILEFYVANRSLSPKAVQDTGMATSAELVAEPQYTIPEAYKVLQQASYPLTLPFDFGLETVRQFFQYFQNPLWEVMELLRPTDELFPPSVPEKDQKPYYQAAIFREYLEISPALYSIFTSSRPLNTWQLLYGYDETTKTEEANQKYALNELKSAKTLARRLGVTYRELMDLVSTNFVNPQLSRLVIIRRARIEVADVVRYQKNVALRNDGTNLSVNKLAELKAFENQLSRLSDQFASSQFNAQKWLDSAWDKGEFNQVLMLDDPDEGCSFERTTLRYSDGSAADAMAFFKLNLFVRLWKKLGWTLEETDYALQVFIPENLMPLTAEKTAEAFRTALLYLAHFKRLEEKLNTSPNSRIPLLTLWSDIFTTGKNSLYAQLFLKPGLLKNDPVFDDPSGNYLTKPGLLIKDHSSTLQAALSLTADEMVLIVKDTGETFDEAKLTLSSLSVLHRYKVLAKALALSIADLIKIKSLSGLNPFQPLSKSAVTELDDDQPYSQTLAFVAATEKIRQSNFSVEDLDYLFRHYFDPLGSYRLADEVPLELIRTLTAGVRQLQIEHALPEPATLNDNLLRQQLSFILPADGVEMFMNLWAGTVVFQAEMNDVAPVDQLDPATLAYEPAIQIYYNETNQVQTLFFKGLLAENKRKKLLETNSSPILAKLLEDVLNQSANQLNAFFETYQLGFAARSEFDVLFSELPLKVKQEQLVTSFWPYLKRTLSHQFIIQTLVTHFKTDLSLTQALLTDPKLLTSTDWPDKPLLDAFINITGADAIGQLTRVTRPNSTQYEGYIEVSSPGAYRFFAQLEENDITVEFKFAHLSNPLFQGTSSADLKEFSQFTELKAGVLYHLTVEVGSLKEGGLKLFIQGANLPKGPLNRLTVYAHSPVQRFQRAYLLLFKALKLLNGFGLTEHEAEYLLTHPADFDGLDLCKIPVEKGAEDSNQTQQFFQQFLRLLDYSYLREQFAGEAQGLINIFKTAHRVHPPSIDLNGVRQQMLQDLCQQVADLYRRDISTVQAVFTHLNYEVNDQAINNEVWLEAPDFRNEKALLRLWKILQLTTQLNVPVNALVNWTRSSSDLATAQGLRNTVKANYDQATWQQIAQPIFDKLRQRQRNALVAYIMNLHEEFERVEQLFEYFLIDPGMEPVVQTSRLRLAISSVQLFIQRCLLNLEDTVHPSTIISEQWQWMKRYRVWEANRKIFLYPENLLEPELRDDKTHLFQSLESTLLQGDVSSDLVESIFYDYLKGLENIAKLELVAMYCEEKANNPGANTLHVFGRTHYLPHKYYYRRYAFTRWTPWEPVTADVEGDHLVPVVWRDRLHLFWITFLEKADQQFSKEESCQDLSSKSLTNLLPQSRIVIQLNWSQYYQGQWSTSESGGFNNPVSVNLPNAVTSYQDIFIHASKQIEDDVEVVIISLDDPVNRAFRVTSKHSSPISIASQSPQELPYKSTNGVKATLRTGEGILEVTFTEKIKFADGEQPQSNQRTATIINSLKSGSEGDFNLLFSTNPVGSAFDSTGEIGSLISPFFYQDSQHNFFVEPSLTVTEIESWESYGMMPEIPDKPTYDLPDHAIDSKWQEPLLVVDVSPLDMVGNPIDYGYPSYQIDNLSRYKTQSKQDILTSSLTLVRYGDSLISQNGRQFAQSANDLSGDLTALDGQGNKFTVIGASGVTRAVVNQHNTQLKSIKNQPNLVGQKGGGLLIKNL